MGFTTKRRFEPSKRDYVYIPLIVFLFVLLITQHAQRRYFEWVAQKFGDVAIDCQKEYFECLDFAEFCKRELSTFTSKVVPAASVTVTCYNSDPAQTDDTPYTTAFNLSTGPGIVAVSRDLLDKGFVPLSKVWIEGFGVFTIGDIMNSRFENRVDIWVDRDADIFKKEDVRIVGFCPCINKSDI